MKSRLRGLAWRLGPFSDCLAVGAIIAGVALLAKQALYYPEIGYDESASWLGVRLFRDFSFGLDIDPKGAVEFIRGAMMDCYPPVYYLVSGLIFQLAGFGIEQARWASIFFVAGAAAACYFGAARAAGRASGAIALGGALFVPLAIYTPTSRPDIGAASLAVISLLLLAEAANRTAFLRLFAASGFTYALAVLSHFIALMAGPVFAMLLWWAVGVQFWRSRSFWAYVAAWLTAILAYVAMIHPYEASTLASLWNYSAIASTGSIADTWPLAPLTAHWRAARSVGGNFAETILIANALCIMPLIVPALRCSLDRRARAILVAGPLLTLSTSFYPNIGVIAYYAPLYCFPLALGVGVASGVLWRALPKTVGAVAGVALCAIVLVMLRDHVERNVARAEHVPVTAALDFFDEAGLDPTRPVLGIAHWIFPKTASSLQSLTGIRDVGGPTFDFPPALLHRVPRYRPIEEAQGLVLDRWGDGVVIQAFLDRLGLSRVQRGGSLFSDQQRLRMERIINYFAAQSLGEAIEYFPDYGPIIRSMTERSIFVHPTFRSGSFTLAQRAKPGQSPWPKMGRGVPGKAVALTIPEACSGSVKVDAPLSADEPDRLAARRFHLPIPDGGDGAFLVRAVVRSGDGFALIAASLAESETAGEAVRNGVAPLVLGSGLTAGGLLTGERGRDFLLIGAARSDAVLTVFGGAGEIVERIDIAFARPEGAACGENMKTVLREIATEIASPEPAPLLLQAPPMQVTAGAPFPLRTRTPLTGSVHVWQYGKLVGIHDFANSAEISVVIPEPGPAGFELWIDSPSKARKLGLVHYLKAI